ncbi:polysaccharide deacetylase family protein [Kordiimonas pumila]|uniref:Chitooligosaccharide deacetylase n=1 Tax=Kordiimonas pumila TaxID=2161677 RepID=A0ABV7D7B3_9PROT|nr:polysaccharide deacetylase family protein [Kordiimonas pumila]
MSTQSPRYDFEPIINRKPVKFPGGKRLAVMIYVNIEHVPFGSTSLAHAVYPMTMQYSPDILNHGWRDYGNRVGLWRIMKAMDEYGFRGTVNLNSDVCREYPQIIEEGNARDWEWGMQGDNNTSIMTVMTEDEERAFISKNVAIVEKATGKRPKGWLGMCLAESFKTPDFLAEAGIEYVSNYAHDELPVPMKVEKGSLLTMPYTLELNDVPTIMGKGTSAEVFGQMIKDQFDVLYEEALELPRVMSISLHPFITGHPFRMKHFKAALAYIAGHDDIWQTTGGEINDWYRANCM